MPSRSIEQTEGEKYYFNALSDYTSKCTNVPSSKDGTVMFAMFAGACDCESTWTTTGSPNVTLSVSCTCREETLSCLNNTDTTSIKG